MTGLPPLSHVLALVSAAAGVAGLVQAALGTWLVARFCRNEERTSLTESVLPAFSILKPLHGDEPLLEEALESCCTQDYPDFEIIFGVQHAADPAIAVVERLRERHPDLVLRLVVSGEQHGVNRKVSNLINMLPAASSDHFVISDSDIHVRPDYLRHLARAVTRPGTGVATTLYAGLPASGSLPRLLSACQINHNFLPGVLLSRYLGRQDCLGATMVITRENLAAVGGLEALAPHVADDAVLGRLVRARGGDITIAGCMTWTTIGERTMGDLLSHELRWGRTVRSLAPGGYLASAIQLPMLWFTLPVLLQPHAVWPLRVFFLAWVLRAVCAFAMDRCVGQRSFIPLVLLPFRDWLSACVMIGSLTGSRVAWRGHTMHVAPHEINPSLPAGD
ncbi:bacteriohopanetetrol glucosamine biosynthesis glycosyltransferase HpnI [Acetobacter sp. AN02]|uniref:bacteriohopanetetrol glucosamine biosynthesis glycosyltransferase HpnI n=1 Tax=Acetobacter sp. AN02 TaxID=2894186 RepID=UPI0024346712|nr:bacteriohopanetetrol glucosamine biosynthesis glycosyltransferase HpnI [Acetobacter sp. AN02]MDG6095664.1 bacteriohopanetetrol glucosamine biosynthesis glycosyltransferase HpnI [Acetobacter sp. AN02]